MKVKHVLTVLGLSLTMGIGAVISIAANQKLEPVKAVDASTDIYLDVSACNWFADDAKVALWNHQGSCWEEFTEDNESGYYKTTLSASCTSFNTFRGSALNWDNKWNQSDDSSFEADKNLMVAGAYSSGKMTFTWDTYSGPVVHTYGLTGSFNGWSGTDEAMTVNGDTASIEITLTQNDQFKIRRDNAWAKSYSYENLASESQAYLDDSGNPDHNMVAKATGVYEIELAISTETVTVTSFTPAAVKYYAKVANGEYAQMTYVKDFTYDETKTGHEYNLTVSGAAGQKVFFKRDSVEIHPGASDPELNNNLFYENNTHFITLVQDATDETLTLKVYEDGYDSFLTGYVAAPKTYYFTNNKGWEGTPNYYAFNANNTPKAPWPGEAMTFQDIDGNGQQRYKFTLDCDKWTTVVIANADGSEQTVNMLMASYTMSDGFYLLDTKDGAGHYEFGTYTYAAVTRSIYVGGVQYALSESAEQPGGDCLIQYESAAISMHGGDQIRVKTGDSISDTFTLEPFNHNNAYNGADYKHVLISATDKVYVKLMNDTSVRVYVGGLTVPNAGYHIYMNDESIVELAQWTGEIPDGYTNQTYCEDITFHKFDKFQLVDLSNENALPVPFVPADGLDTYSDENFIFEDNYIKYIGVNNYEASVYLKLLAGHDQIFVGAVDPIITAAKNFAEAFNTAIAAVCDASGATTKQSELEEAWEAQATAYAALSADVKAALKTNSSVSEILAFRAKYESVYRLRKLGSGWDLDNFLEMSIASNTIGLRVERNDTILLVVVLSLTAILASAGVMFYLLRKKRYN